MPLEETDFNGELPQRAEVKSNKFLHFTRRVIQGISLCNVCVNSCDICNTGMYSKCQAVDFFANLLKRKEMYLR